MLGAHIGILNDTVIVRKKTPNRINKSLKIDITTNAGTLRS